MRSFPTLAGVLILCGAATARDREFDALVQRGRVEDTRRPIFTEEGDFTSLMQGALGTDWKPFVRVQDRRSNEWTCMYAGASGNQWKLLIANMERREATLIRIKLNPEGMLKWIQNPCHETRTWRRD